MKEIKKSSFSRGLRVAKLGLKTGLKAAGNYISPKEQEDYLIEQMKLIADELGELKGTMMKVGQGLSMYGEHFLPPKANEMLKSLQSSSPPLDWESIETTLEKELGMKAFSELDIDEEALAAASLGQVHKAVIKKTGEVIALKVQYPGVDSAMHSDVKNLKRVFSLGKIFPSEMKLDLIFQEIQGMLLGELDYSKELYWTDTVYNNLKDDPRYLVPKPIPEFCTKKIMATSFIEGVPVDSDEVLNLSQESRNKIGYAFLEHYFNELFLFKSVQTDPHLGNYRINLTDPENPKLVLLDFGAMKEVPDSFGEPFKKLIRAALKDDTDTMIEAAETMGYLKPDDPQKLVDSYIKLCSLIVEPFSTSGLEECEYINKDKEYVWKETDLPKRVAAAGTQIAKNFKLRTPPKESLFLDRKLGGTFIFLSVLNFQAYCDDWIKDRI